MSGSRTYAHRTENDTPQGSSKKIKDKETAKWRRKNVRIAGVVMIAILLLSVGSSRVTATDQPSVENGALKIDNFAFGPQAITVTVGTTVTRTNSDDIPHTAVRTDGVFKSKVMDTDEQLS